MSLLEDVFLQNEADEAQELERVIDGDEYDDRPRPSTPDSDENSEKEDEAEEDKRRVDPSKAKEKRVVKNPRFILNPARLTGPRGIQIIPDHYKDFKFKGKGHEKEDLDLVLKKLEHWAYRLFPKFKFEDCLKKIETLGKKKPVMVHLHKIRTDQFTSEETIVQKDSSDEEEAPIVQEEDEFDKLLQQQIELARATPAPGSVKKGFDTPRPEKCLLMPKSTSSPSINDEQRERMLKNRRLAEERRLAKLKQHSSTNNSVNDTQDKMNTGTNDLVNKDTVVGKNRSRILDSSDEECDITIVNQSITVDIHNTSNKEMKREEETVLEKLNDGCEGDIELDAVDKDKDALKKVEVSHIGLDTDPIQNDIEIISTENKVGNQIGLKGTNASQGNIELIDTVNKEVKTGVNEANSMDITTESNLSNNCKEKKLSAEGTDLNIDSNTVNIINSNSGNNTRGIPGINNVVKNNNKSDKNESLNKSFENISNEEKGNDDFGDDLDIMDVDFNEEF